MKTILMVLLAGMALMVVGCVATTTNTPTNSSKVNSQGDDFSTIRSDQRYIASEPLVIQESGSTVGRFNSKMIFLADQLERNADRKSLSNTFIVTSFVNLNRLSETTPFGRLVAENVIHELQVRKWHVFEVRLTKDIIVNESGEFSLSRDIKKLKDQYQIGGIVTGTYSISGGHAILNARVIDINTGVVVSSGQVHIPVNWFVDELLVHDNHMKAMKVVGDTPFSCRDVATCSAAEAAAAAPAATKIVGGGH